MKCPNCVIINVEYMVHDNSYFCTNCKKKFIAFTPLKEIKDNDMPNQEMTPVPETRSTNAPSQAAIDEAYQRGYNKALADFNIRLKIAKHLLDTPGKAPTVKLMIHKIFNLLDQFMSLSMAEINKSHHHGDE